MLSGRASATSRLADATVFSLVAGLAIAAVITTWKLLQADLTGFGLDLPAYTEAARRLLLTGSPYSSALHNGPIEHGGENIPVAYLYPPPLAQLFVPLTLIPMPMLALVWAGSQSVILASLLVVLHRRRGGQTDPRTVALIVLAATAYHPTLIAIVVGNVSGWIAILACLILVAKPSVRSVAAASIAWLKVTPGAFAIGAVLDRESRRSALLAGIGILAISVVLAPFAWLDWVEVLPALVAMPPGDFFFNFAPSHVLVSGNLEALAPLAAVALPAAFLGLTVLNGVQGRQLAWVAAAAGVYLSATATTWHQYFVILVPIAVAAWPSAPSSLRAVIVLNWLWYSMLWFAIPASWHQLIGLGLWLLFLLWVSVGWGRDRVRLSMPMPFPRAIQAEVKR